MTHQDIIRLRLYNQHIAKPLDGSPAAVVSSQLAMQAQDYAGALWSVGLRLPQATQADIERAIDNRQIVRTWPMRGTLHFLAADDIRWMLALLAPRVLAATASRRRNLKLDDTVFALAQRLITAALQGGKVLTRNQLLEELEKGGITTAGQRGIHILAHLSQQAVICFGPHQEKLPTFVLLDEWIPTSKKLTRDQALAELAQRFFTGHGPATIQDLSRWAGLTLRDARAGLEAASSQLASETVDGQVYWMAPAPAAPHDPSAIYLLPGFDEYILGYKDRSLMLELEHSQKIVPGNNGVFMPTIVSDGQVIGTWKRLVKKDTVHITLLPFVKISPAQQAAAEVSASRYAAFTGKTPVVTLSQ